MPSPIGWLQLMANSRYVITNSYHGTLFAVIFEKPFLVIPRIKSDNRFLSFLTRMGLESRIYNKESGSMEEQLQASINWKFVNERKEEFIKQSKDFIKSCIHQAGVEKSI